MKTIVITPAYNHAHHALHEAIRQSRLPWLPVYEQSDLVKVRSVLISTALNNGAETIILVDADNVPAPGVLQAISKMPTPELAVFAIYRQRDGKRLSVEPLNAADAAERIKAGETFGISFGGLGLAAVHRDSLLRVRETLPVVAESGFSWAPFCLPFVQDGVYHGDDKSLCYRLRSVGVNLVADPKLRVGHAIASVVEAFG